MRDSFGRQVDYLRLSVTQRCDLRCAYCRPARDCESPRELCDLEELTELAAACVELGVKKIRLTGGEPLVRPDLVELVGRLRALPGLEELCLTTNGQRLAELAAPLRAAGLDRLNISLDSLRPARYRALTGGELERTLAEIEAAEAAGFTGLRLNTVLLRGVNEDELAELAGLARTHPWSVRFIELMPIGPGAAMPEAFLPAARVLEAVPELREAGQAGRPARGDGSQPSAPSGEAAGSRQQATGNRQQATDKPPLPRGGGPASRPVEGWPRGQSPSDDSDKATGQGIGNRESENGGTGPSAPLRCAQDDEYGALSARRDGSQPGSQPSAPSGEAAGAAPARRDGSQPSAPSGVTVRGEGVVPITGAVEQNAYRNKAQYPIGIDKDGQPVAGFYAGRTHSIIPNTRCYLGTEENEEILNTLLSYMKEYGVLAYDETTGKGLIRHVLIRKGFTTGELMVCLVINHRISSEINIKGNTAVNKSKNKVEVEWIPHQQKLIDELTKITGMKSISVNINTENTNVIMGTEVHTIWGDPTISDVIHVRDMQKEGFAYTGDSLNFNISPLSFYQVNPVQTEKLYSLALEYAGLTGKESVWDLYCGIGTISLFMARKAKQVYGVEIVEQAIDDARKNAKRNGITNARFFVGKAEEVLPEFYMENDVDGEMLHPDVIVVDPPRKGCDEACLSTMLKMQPDRIVYVSCDSATLARDLKILCEGGYQIKKIRGVDQFGHTVHVETVCLLSNINYRGN